MSQKLKEIYSCPMHPEIQRTASGVCPICGMDLESLYADAKEDEGLSIKTRFLVSLGLTIPVVLLSMLNKFPIAQAVLTLPIVFWCGALFFYRGFFLKNLNMFTLISLGIFAAYFYSLLSFFIPSIEGLYFESAAVITTLSLLGQLLEWKGREKTKKSIQGLLKLVPVLAHRLPEEKSIPLEEVAIGDLLRVFPGEQIPVDGMIVDGQSYLDESSITGESAPVQKGINDRVIAGTVNGNGSFILKAEKIGEQTVIARIIHLVKEAQNSKTNLQTLADHAASYFVPIVILLALGTTFFFHFSSEGWMRAISVLVIACPCALGLAVPMSVMVGVGLGAREGILVRNAASFEKLAKLDTLVFDKTGTLTEGKLMVDEAVPQGDIDLKKLIALTGGIAALSEHPLAAAIAKFAKNKEVAFSKADSFHSYPGKGIEGLIDKKKIRIGSYAWIKALGIECSEIERVGKTVLYAASDNEWIGFFSLSDSLRPSTVPALISLKKEGIDPVMMTGDSMKTAAAVANQTGIDHFYANLLPEDKLKKITELQSKGHKVGMTGDGINDAPALAQADVGIAMGSGTDVAIQNADIALLHSDLNGIRKAIKLGKVVVRNMKENLILAFLYNVLAIPLAMGAFGFNLNPMIASSAMIFTSLSVIGNALRISKRLSLK